MKKIRINAKSTPIESEIMAKISAGFKNIEIQLIKARTSQSDYDCTKKMIEEQKIDISVVHTPLLKGFELSLDRMLEKENFAMFEDTCKYAEFVAQLENHKIKVVVHDDYSKQTWQITRLLEEKLAPQIVNVLTKYTHVDLVIENSVFFDKENFRTVKDMEDVSFAVKVLNQFANGRAKTLLDTCHMMMTWEGLKRIYGQNLTNWDDAFKKATMYTPLGLIHLNNMHDNGDGKDHSIAFDFDNLDDRKKLKQIMTAYQKYADCEITIEVKENDYISSPCNLTKTKNALEKMGYILNIDSNIK